MIDGLRELQRQLTSLDKRLQQLKSSRVTQHAIRETAKQIVDLYFRSVRELLVDNGNLTERVDVCDDEMHFLLDLTHKSSRTTTYRKQVRALQEILLATEKQALISTKSNQRLSKNDAVDTRIIETLKQLVPSATLSYQQALLDLQVNQRLSWRGPATDLREALRETLDYLAPDEEVKSQEGFQLEPNTTGPTTKQKVRYVLKKRGLPKSASQTSEDAAQAVDTAIGTIVRSVYTRSSLSTHTPTDKREIIRIRDWVRVVMCELLEI